jgi:hypothetical protein
MMARTGATGPKKMRMIAEDMISIPNKAIAQRLADSYERLAKLAEEQAESKKRTDT